MLPALVALFDPSYITCTENYQSFLWTPTNVSKLFVGFVLFLVYVSVVKVRLDRKVSPVVNIPTMPEEVVNTGQNTSRMQGIDKDLNMIHKLDTDCGIPNLGASYSKFNQA